MTLSEFQQQLEGWWADADSRAMALKDSQGALLEFVKLYQALDPEERDLADRVISSWIRSENARKRFDALAITDQFRIRTAVPALKDAEVELAGSKDPGAPYELAKIRRILRHIGA